MNLKLSHLRLIAAVAELGQLQVAAAQLALTQPAASRMLADIERIVRAPVFERHPKGMTLTPVGRVLARRAQAMIVTMHDLEAEVDELRQGRSGAVRVGSVTGPAVGSMVPAIRQLRGHAPDAQVAVDVAPSGQLMRGLMAGDYDFVIARLTPDLRQSDFVMHPAGSEIVRFLARRDHPMSSQRGVSLEALSRYEWIIQERGTPVRHTVEEALALSGAPLPAHVITTSSLLVMMALLVDSNAIAPVSAEVVSLMTGPGMGRFAALDVAGDMVVPPYYVIEVRGRQMSAIAARLRALVLAELRAADRTTHHPPPPRQNAAR
ncbi:LysR family transcriptional regulator [Falsirhodobacter halotolerans]|uniref:LysR family transcriptional regulator n=1 Tax=Falsirhodobacter halotolerans TaxID=1146892 RepID=UPI001FD2A49C|nr:LysR family transcriptional regulator [Falsirhodobacter halotolerans]MCJ8141096.1 LysR family transcriptional regulator [Falsirhodobacter halotolerans]